MVSMLISDSDMHRELILHVFCPCVKAEDEENNRGAILDDGSSSGSSSEGDEEDADELEAEE